MGRNTLRLSEKQFLILDLLGAKERYGLELVEMSDGQLKRGTVYVTLGRMEDRDLVESRLAEREPGESGLARRLYVATNKGRECSRAEKGWRRQIAMVESC